MNISGIGGAPVYCGYQRGAGKASGATFAETLEARKENKDVSSFCGKDKTPEAMTAEEYRFYIDCKVASMGRNTSRYRDTFVFISDDGYKAMQNDPGYEKQVLDRIRSAYSYSRYGFSKDKETVHTALIIGASDEDSRYESWSSNDFKGPPAEELRRFRLERRLKSEKLRKYRKALQDNSIEKADKELDHIKGIYRDNIYAHKNISAQMNINKMFFRQG